MADDRFDPKDDYATECPRKDCGAQVGEPCKGLPPKMVHFARRILLQYRGK